MIVSADIALKVFRKVRQFREAYLATLPHADHNVLSVEDLHWVYEQQYEIKVFKQLVVFDGDFIRGMVERWPDRLQIWVRADQPPDWLRFTAVKELAHGIIDEPEDWSVDGTSTLANVLVEYALVEGQQAPRATQSEVFAELAAIELMYPFDLRAGDIAKMASGETTLTKIATYHGMPVPMVSRALGTGHMTFATRMWTELDKALAPA